MVALGWARLGLSGLDWIRLGSTGLERARLGLTWLDRARLGSIGLAWSVSAEWDSSVVVVVKVMRFHTPVENSDETP